MSESISIAEEIALIEKSELYKVFYDYFQSLSTWKLNSYYVLENLIVFLAALCVCLVIYGMNVSKKERFIFCTLTASLFPLSFFIAPYLMLSSTAYNEMPYSSKVFQAAFKDSKEIFDTKEKQEMLVHCVLNSNKFKINTFKKCTEEIEKNLTKSTEFKCESTQNYTKCEYTSPYFKLANMPLNEENQKRKEEVFKLLSKEDE